MRKSEEGTQRGPWPGLRRRLKKVNKGDTQGGEARGRDLCHCLPSFFLHVFLNINDRGRTDNGKRQLRLKVSRWGIGGHSFVKGFAA